MSDELLKIAATWEANPLTERMLTANEMMAIQGLIGRLAARVRELEGERDDYKAQAKEYWDIGLKREQERDALRAENKRLRAVWNCHE